MNITEPIKDQIRFLPGDICYLKQDVLNDRSRLTVNGHDVDHFDLQKAYVIVYIEIQINTRTGGLYRYVVRPQRTFGEEEKLLALQEAEVLSQAEAVAIIRLRDSR